MKNDINKMDAKAQEIFLHNTQEVYVKTDRLFLWILLGQWVFAIILSLVLSPLAWEGKASAVHLHLQIAIFFGGFINALPIFLILKRPGWIGTRYVIAIAQMLWSALLIHLTGGRIETHFHVFGSLAFLAVYRDWRVLIPATVTVAADHFLRGLFWPESVYGILNPEWWRFLEHAAWVIFEDSILIVSCLRSVKEMKLMAMREAMLETACEKIEQQVVERTTELNESKEQYRALMETTSAIIPWEWNPMENVCTYMGPQVERLWGWSAEQFYEKNFLFDCLHPDDRSLMRQAFSNVIAGRNVSVEYRIKKKDGNYAHVRSFLSKGMVVDSYAYIRGVSLDVTVQKKIEAELHQEQKAQMTERTGGLRQANNPIQFISDSMNFVRDSMNELSTLIDKYEALNKSGAKKSTEVEEETAKQDLN